MKKITLCLMATCLSLTFQPVHIQAAANSASSTLVVAKSTEAEALLTRLHNINEMDKSNLSSSERKHLRVEVRTIKNHLKDIGGGVYLSAGAIILVVILLILK